MRLVPSGSSWRPAEWPRLRTSVAFEGRTAYGERSRIPFHVTSADWQESDRVLAGILTVFGAPTRVVAVGGYGQFDGVMLGSFRRPRVEGRFAGEKVRAWGVFWGTGGGEIVVEDGYVDVTNGFVRDGPSELHIDGRFATGYPRRDGGEEINARFGLVSRPAGDFRDAFRLEGYPRGRCAVRGAPPVWSVRTGPLGSGA